MKLHKPLSCAVAGLILAIAANDYLWLNNLGFPDGSITELDRARIPLYKAFIALSFLCGAYFVYLGAMASEQRRKGRFLAALALYTLILAATLSIDRYFGTYLRGGEGG